MKDRVTKRALDRLVEVGGRTAHDLGFGRVPGEVLAYLYFVPGERSLTEISEELGLSKAALSVAVRQLEGLGLVWRCRKKGDRNNYYRTAEKLGDALQNGVFRIMRQKLDVIESELGHVEQLVSDATSGEGAAELEHLRRQLSRASTLRRRLAGLLNSRLLRLFGRL